MLNQASSCRDVASCAQESTTENLTLLGRFSALLISVTDAIFDRLDQQRAYRTLQAMDDRILDDIGLSRSDVEALKDRRS